MWPRRDGLNRPRLSAVIVLLPVSGPVRNPQRRPDVSGLGGYNHRLTEAGADLAGVVTALANWGRQWVDVTAEQSDPAYALWAWCQVQIDTSALPDGRVVVAFVFAEERPMNRRFGC